MNLKNKNLLGMKGVLSEKACLCWFMGYEHLENKIGNLTETSLDKIWNSEIMNRWRLAHIEGRFEDSGSLCLRCNWRSAGGLSEDRAEEWLKKNQGHARHLSKRKRLLYWLRKVLVSNGHS